MFRSKLPNKTAFSKKFSFNEFHQSVSIGSFIRAVLCKVFRFNFGYLFYIRVRAQLLIMIRDTLYMIDTDWVINSFSSIVFVFKDRTLYLVSFCKQTSNCYNNQHLCHPVWLRRDSLFAKGFLLPIHRQLSTIKKRVWSLNGYL